MSDRIANELETRILNGTILAGDQLPTEGELVELFGVSRTVIRDAVRGLTARGILDVRAGRGTIVLPPNDETMCQLMLSQMMRSELSMGEVMDARASLDIQFVPLAATRATEDQINEVAAAFAAFEEAVGTEGRDGAQERTHLAFHLALLAATDLPALQLMLRPLEQVIILCSMPAVTEADDIWDLDHHRQILAALRTRDPDRLRAALEAHYGFQSSPEYVARRAERFRDSDVVRQMLPVT
ncbi:MAG: FCD domain-containing protein [Solirubrobacteraceae bacterium]